MSSWLQYSFLCFSQPVEQLAGKIRKAQELQLMIFVSKGEKIRCQMMNPQLNQKMKNQKNNLKNRICPKH